MSMPNQDQDAVFNLDAMVGKLTQDELGESAPQKTSPTQVFIDSNDIVRPPGPNNTTPPGGAVGTRAHFHQVLPSHEHHPLPSGDSMHLEVESDDEDEVNPSANESVHTTPEAPVGRQRPAPQHRNLYVANLPQSITARRLTSMFAEYGKINDVKLLLDIATGSSRGIGFIMYEDPESAKEAVNKMHRLLIEGHLIQCRYAEKNTEKKYSKITGKTVYVRNIPKTSNKAAILSYFSRIGDVTEIDFHPQSAEVGGPSPYNMTFITFADDSSAAKAVDLVDGHNAFPLPNTGHPFLVAKVIEDIVAEKRKSVILRPRFTPNQGPMPLPTSQQHDNNGSNASPPPLPAFNVSQSYTQNLSHSQSQSPQGPFDLNESSLGSTRRYGSGANQADSLLQSSSFLTTTTLPSQQSPTSFSMQGSPGNMMSPSASVSPMISTNWQGSTGNNAPPTKFLLSGQSQSPPNQSHPSQGQGQQIYMRLPQQQQPQQQQRQGQHSMNLLPAYSGAAQQQQQRQAQFNPSASYPPPRAQQQQNYTTQQLLAMLAQQQQMQQQLPQPQQHQHQQLSSQDYNAQLEAAAHQVAQAQASFRLLQQQQQQHHMMMQQYQQHNQGQGQGQGQQQFPPQYVGGMRTNY